MHHRKHLLTSVVLLAAAACADPTGSSPAKPSRYIEDGVHNFGNIHFYWLQPTVPNAPSYTGAFGPSYYPAIDLCKFANGGCVGSSMRWTRTGGPLNAKIYTSAANEAYSLVIPTATLGWQVGEVYRARMQIMRTRLGLIDILVVADDAEAATVDLTKYTPVVKDQPVTLKWRLEEGLFLPMDPNNAGTLYPLAGAVVYDYQAGTVANEVPITTQPADPDNFNNVLNRVIYGTHYKLGPDQILFLIPVRLSIAYDEADLPPGLDETTLRIHRWNGGGGYWQPCANGAVDTVNNFASCDISTAAGIYAIRY